MSNSRFRCPGCKKYFPIEQAASTNGLQRFCSSSCARPGRPASTNDRSPVNRLVRAPSSARKPMVTVTKSPPKKKGKDSVPHEVWEDVMKRDNHRCVRCGKPNPSLHHVKYRSEGVDHSPHNLVALCVDCHNPVIHANKRYWKPICLAYIWLRDVERRTLTLGQVEKLVEKLGG